MPHLHRLGALVSAAVLLLGAASGELQDCVCYERRGIDTANGRESDAKCDDRQEISRAGATALRSNALLPLSDRIVLCRVRVALFPRATPCLGGCVRIAICSRGFQARARHSCGVRVSWADAPRSSHTACARSSPLSPRKRRSGMAKTRFVMTDDMSDCVHPQKAQSRVPRRARAACAS
eukprot:737629-Prymnesium_polylepis.2